LCRRIGEWRCTGKDEDFLLFIRCASILARRIRFYLRFNTVFFLLACIVLECRREHDLRLVERLIFPSPVETANFPLYLED
jgi:hypothetical protein